MKNARRKDMRLRSWDYGDSAWYFITVCCKQMQELFGEVVVRDNSAAMLLNERGKCCESVLRDACDTDKNPSVIVFVVMPNHVHFIVAVDKDDDSSVSLGQFVHFIKSAVSRAIHKTEPGISVWHRGYYDHIIRDDEDLERIMEYIRNNPGKWFEDRYYSD